MQTVALGTTAKTLLENTIRLYRGCLSAEVSSEEREFANFLIERTGLTLDAMETLYLLGEEFSPIKNRTGVRQPGGQCFENAYREAVFKNLVYAEGVGVHPCLKNPIPTVHAWLSPARRECTAIDNTWEEPEKCLYFGIRMPLALHQKMQVEIKRPEDPFHFLERMPEYTWVLESKSERLAVAAFACTETADLVSAVFLCLKQNMSQKVYSLPR